MDIDGVNGLGSDDDKGNEVVFELDLYAGGNSAFGKPTSQGYVLQFPQRSPDRPYEDPYHVQIKNKVKRMQWDIPLSTVQNYNPDADPATKVRSFTLQSTRVDPGMHGLAVGVRQGNAVYLLPVSEVLQMRHSPAYLDKEQEKQKEKEKEKEAEKRRAGGADGAGPSGVAIKEEDGGNASELMPITVQVKKHETEQQTEARLRSYAFHAAQEDADPWIQLKFLPPESHAAVTLLDKIPTRVNKADVAVVANSPESYLQAIVPGSTIGHDGALDAGVAGAANELGKPVGQLGNPAEVLSPEATAALPSQLGAFFIAAPVLSLDNIRAMMLNLHSQPALKRAAETISDPALHAAIVASGEIVSIRKSYTLRVTNNPTTDPLRAVVLHLLQEKETVKRSDVTDAATARNINVTDAMYQRVMKELCTSRGSNWSIKTGS